MSGTTTPAWSPMAPGDITTLVLDFGPGLASTDAITGTPVADRFDGSLSVLSVTNLGRMVAVQVQAHQNVSTPGKPTGLSITVNTNLGETKTRNGTVLIASF